MSIRDLNLITRKPGSLKIDVQGTLQAFAKELIAWKDEEKRIRTSRRYKAAIRRIFKRFDYRRIPSPALIALCIQDMNVRVDDYQLVKDELEKHIRFNRGGYLRTVPGKAGGIELTKP
jgi:hypothetical protein